MNIIEPGFEVLDDLDGRRMLRKIEAAGRTDKGGFCSSPLLSTD